MSIRSFGVTFCWNFRVNPIAAKKKQRKGNKFEPKNEMPERMEISPEPKYQEPRVTRLEMVLKQTSTYFNTELKKAIADGRLKINEDDILESGPNYSHTTNGKELEYQQRRIFVGHLPVDYLSKDEIYYMFEKYGTIIAIRNVLQ